MNAIESAPSFFGPADAHLFGWFHAASRPASIGLVICSPFGFEEICSHRSLKRFAEAAAEKGIPSLRFDYAGCGDSHGDPFGPAMLAAWIGSAHEAIDHLKASSGVQAVCLLGLRLGATIATLAAEGRDDVAALVAIAPVTRGRSYVRELRVLGGSVEGKGLQSAGFMLSTDTAAALGKLDLLALTKSPAPAILIVDRDDLPAGHDWHDHLARLGGKVRSETWPGYEQMMVDAQRAVAPEAIIEGTLEWLRQLPAHQPGPARTAATGARADASIVALPQAIAESIVQLDTGTSKLFGILTRPTRDASQASAGRRGVVLLNSGCVHHVGPNRLWVELARRWAAQGVTVLRLDLSGLGDNEPRAGEPENLVYPRHAARDMTLAVEHMRTWAGVDECHLAGLCSGAFHAFVAAAAGPGIASSIMINPLAYSWDHDAAPSGGIQEYEVMKHSAAYRRKMFSIEPWRRLLRGELDLRVIANVIGRAATGGIGRIAEKARQKLGIASANDLDTALSQAVKHGTRLNFVFGEGHPGQDLLARDSRHALPRLLAKHSLSIDIIADTDHTFTDHAARQRLIETLDRLMLHAAPATGGARGANAARHLADAVCSGHGSLA